MKENAIDFLQQLVSIRSLSGKETAVAHFLVDEMAQLGFDAFVDEAGNAVGRVGMANESGEFEQTILLLGHMDTVPGEIPVRIEEGKLYGRGSVDAKGPLATFVQATAQAQLRPGVRVIIIGAVEEESATSKGARFAATQYQPDFCVIGEPSGWDGVTLGYKGRLLVDYEWRQPMSHTAGPARGVAETAIDWWNELESFCQRFNDGRSKLFDQLMPSLRQFHTSSTGLENIATLKVSIRLPPDFDVANFQKQICERAGEATLCFYGYEAAFVSNRRHLLARQLNRAIRQEGGTPIFKVKTGTSDMNVVGPNWDCPIVAYGPGDSNLDHTPDEHLVLADYLKSIEILQSVLVSI